MSQDPRKITKESSFLQPKETKMPPSDDPTSPREKKRARTSQEQRESPQDSSFLSSVETEKHIMSQESYETSRSSVSPMNRDEEAFKSRHGLFSENPKYFDSNNITMNTGNLLNPFRVGGSLDSAGNMGSQKYRMPTPGYVNSSTNNKNNNGQSYLGVEASNNSVDVRTGMQQKMSNSSVIGVDSGTWFANSDEDFQQAYGNLQRLGMPGEGYGTNNPDLFGDQSGFYLGSGGTIASMSSQRDSLRPEMQQKMSNVSNSSIGGGVGMYAKSIDSGTSFTSTTRNLQPAYGNLQRLGMPGEGYTNNPVAGYNVSNSSISGSVGMNAKSVDSGSSFTSTTRNPQHAYDNYQCSGMQGERYGSNSSDPSGYRSNISLGPVGSIESKMKAQKDKKKIDMIPNPIFVDGPPWTIKKKLTKADVYSTSDRLNLYKPSIEKHILIHLSEADSQNIDRGKPGIIVNVYDHDTRTMHELRLAYLFNYVLMDGWLEDFVQRRSLKQGDEVGLLWDSSASRLQFGVISRATQKLHKI